MTKIKFNYKLLVVFQNMIQSITKSIYLDYIDCAKNAWLKLHKPELKEFFEQSSGEKNLMSQGMQVEQLAQALFTGGTTIEMANGNSQDAIALTKKHMEQKTPVLFQSTFAIDLFLVRNDVLCYDSQSDKWNLYEIKGTSSVAQAHIEDAAFQAIVLKAARIDLGHIFIIHLNNQYKLGDYLDVNGLFSIVNVTDQVIASEQSVRTKMLQTKADLSQKDADNVFCQCIYKSRTNHCNTFRYSHAHVPPYSVHDIARIVPKKLGYLVDSGSLHIDDIDDNVELSKNQKLQIAVYKKQTPFIDHELITQELDRLVYPLYFLDYETNGQAIPRLKGFYPYQQMPFQFSLHVLNAPEDECQHFEYLHEADSDSSIVIIDKLQGHIGPVGTIVVWNQAFEKKINNELAERHTQHLLFLDTINNRMYDLMAIFAKQMYVHHLFKGKTSIKSVLPVLCPELSYKSLNVQEGASASQAWFEMVHGDMSPEGRMKMAMDLRKYCQLDTYAMYAIWRYLWTMIKSM